MRLSRRGFLAGSGVTVAAGAAVVTTGRYGDEFALKSTVWPDPKSTGSLGPWNRVRALFALSPDWIDMSAMLLASHPKPVADAIERHRRALDLNPVLYLGDSNRRLHDAVREAAALYVGGTEARDIALTDSTTMGVALVYQGLRLMPGQEVLTTEQDYYVTHESLRLAAARSGASVRRVPLYGRDEVAGIAADQLVERIIGEVRPETRAVALTWVHSSTGLKMPVGAIAAALERVNADRDESGKVLLCVDGVHGFGNQDADFDELGCDFLMAGCHKWLFGPRGTGVVIGSRRGWEAVSPSIPSFLDGAAYGRWMRNDPAAPSTTTAAMFTPGGFKAFEHVWALSEAFDLHRSIGRKLVAERTAELAGSLKEGLRAIPGVTVRTPASPELSAGIVSFDVEGLDPDAVVGQLREHRIIASVAPYARPHVRLTPSIRNTPDEIETALRAMRTIAVS
jgi:isopenicillin-N epimerase